MHIRGLVIPLAVAWSVSAHAETVFTGSVSPLPAGAVEAVVGSDGVHVRATPRLKGKTVGLLYNRMVVRLLEFSGTPGGEAASGWWRIERDGLTGWCATNDLEPRSEHQPEEDTYWAGGDLSWYFSRYGTATNGRTAAYAGAVAKGAASFSLDEYRDLMSAVERQDPLAAPLARHMLEVTIYSGLLKPPVEPAYRYLRTKLYSDDFMLLMLAGDAASGADSGRLVPDDWWTTARAVAVLGRIGVRTTIAVLPAGFRGNRELAAKLTDEDLRIGYGYFDETIRADPAIALRALRRYGGNYPFLPEPLRSAKSFVRAAMKSEGGPQDFQKIPPHLRRDPEIYALAVAGWAGNYRWIPDAAREDRSIVLLAARAPGVAEVYGEFPVKLRSDPEVALAALESDGNAYARFPSDVRAVRRVAMSAVSRVAGNIGLIPGRLLRDPGIIDKWFEGETWSGYMDPLPPPLCNDRALAVRCAGKEPRAICAFSEKIRDDAGIMAPLLKENECDLVHCLGPTLARDYPEDWWDQHCGP